MPRKKTVAPNPKPDPVLIADDKEMSPDPVPEPKPKAGPEIKDIADLKFGQIFKFGNNIGRLNNRRTDTGELMHCAARLEPIKGANGYNQVGVIRLPSGTKVTVIS